VTIRVVVADDQPLMRAAYDMTLRGEEDIELVGEAADGGEAIEAARRLRPDVILMDVRMPVMDGVEAMKTLAAEQSAIRILMLTTFDIDAYVIEALRAGASGFLLKDVSPDELIRAIRVVAAGDAFLAPSVIQALLGSPESAVDREKEPTNVLAALTESEIKVLTLVGRGLSNQEIAQALFIADTTVRTHLRHILDKLHLRDRLQAVVLAYDTGLVQPVPR
jgi:DNA-binding NarL/FixJ family response regulator